ncbi:putative RNA-binding protein, snRNP like protein [Thermobacillus composti KWC4]|uniref:Rqc2 homolog RqcH n=1 Tax=Thermobacillus composti (strain DSM 18247 / JCM 13945 / KWC4) TaxID=717605 RepID=L0EFA0_THECK|nr:NFACT RNA binding domain-containing protein [Thermobacillus composti]AGA58314.1 putative RNA-binding protein, snRNP like protein [Thermobacillus composti KWC4]
MSLDGIVVRAIAHELRQLAGTRIHRIHQPDDHTLVLQLRGGGLRGQSRLLLSANPTYPRVHWVTRPQPNPLEAPMFCMLMRKHCEGGVIETVTQPGCERVLHIDIRQRDELGDISLKRIVVELMGRHSNIILTDPATGRIYDGIHHVTPAISSYRVVMPGSAYTPPPEQAKADPLAVPDFARFAESLRPAEGDSPPDRRLVDAYAGISPLLAREIVHRAAAADAPDGTEALWRAFRDVMEGFRSHGYEPNIVDRDGRTFFSVTRLTHLDGDVRTFDSILECLEIYYGDKAERDLVRQKSADLHRFLLNEKTKNEKKIEKLEATLEEAKEADRYRITGELIIANMHAIQKGQPYVEVIDYYDERQPVVTIELDPQLTPSENAQRWFKRYNKAKNSITAAAAQMEAAREEIAYFDTLLAQLETASLQDIEEIREELAEQGYLKQRGGAGAKKRKPSRPALLCYTSSENVPIYVGKNNTQNEYLTNRLASPNDTWLHTKDIPGSHVVIRGTGFGNATLEEAAMLAAYYSRGKESSLVPVDYTLIRHVRKPSGAKPGFVIYDHQKTLFVTPDEERIKALPVRTVT